MNDRIEQLAKIDLFAGLKPQAIELIAKVSTEESHALGTKIFQHGDAGDKLYLILEGKVRISRDVAGMGEEALAVLGPGQAVGVERVAEDQQRLAVLVAHQQQLRGVGIGEGQFVERGHPVVQVLDRGGNLERWRRACGIW